MKTGICKDEFLTIY